MSIGEASPGVDFLEEELYVQDMVAEPDVAESQGSVPDGSLDWKEARMIGLHVEHGYPVSLRGDHYFNDRNGARLHSGGLTIAAVDYHGAYFEG